MATFLKKKTSINGYVWVGKNLLPSLVFYSFFFIGAFAMEVCIMFLSLVVKSLVIETSFLFLTGMTIVAMILFVIEELMLHRKLNSKKA
jgi:hypothetical protein